MIKPITITPEPDGRQAAIPYGPRAKLDDDEALALIQRRGRSVENGMDPTHVGLQRQWFLNAVQFLGQQNLDTAEILDQFDPDLQVDDLSYVANHIMPIVNGNVARKSQAKPHWEVIPNSPDQQDQDGSKAGQQLLDFAYEELKMRRHRRDLALYLELFGTGFVVTDWDQKKGDQVSIYRDPKTNMPIDASQLDPGEKQFMGSMGAREDRTGGDWVVETLMPFQIKVPAGFAEMEDMPWICIERFRSMEWLWDHYPKKAEGITPSMSDSTSSDAWWRRLSSVVSSYGQAPINRGEMDEDGVIVRELWIPPSALLKKGATIVECQGQLLENSPHRFAAAGLEMRWPLKDFHNVRMPGRFWGISSVEQLIGPQREYNRARSQLIQQRDTLATPQWISDRANGLTATRNEYGDIWEYDGQRGTPPQLVAPPPLPPHHVQTEERAIYDLQTLGSMSEASRGQVPEGVRSGIAIRALQEKDMMTLAPTIEGLEEGFETVGRNLLTLAWKFMELPRAISIYGESRANDMMILKGADLHGNLRVRVKAGSMAPQSKTQAVSDIMELMTLGALNPAQVPADRRKVWNVLELGTTDPMFLMEDLDRRRAKIENHMFVRPVNGFPDVDDYDDHQAHFEEHLLFMKTDTFERLPPIRKMAFKAHLAKHEMVVAQMQQAAMMMQGGAGAPGGGGGNGGSPPAEKGEASQPAQKNPTPGSEPVGNR